MEKFKENPDFITQKVIYGPLSFSFQLQARSILLMNLLEVTKSVRLVYGIPHYKIKRTVQTQGSN